MTQIEQWRQADNEFSSTAQSAINAMEEGRKIDALQYVEDLVWLYRDQLSRAVGIETFGWRLGMLIPTQNRAAQ